MSTTVSPAMLDEMDRFYREEGLAAMTSPHVHYDQPDCPHPGCGHRMQWIDFKLELYGDRAGIDDPLVKAFFTNGFAGRCPRCEGLIRFTTRSMEQLDELDAGRYPRLPGHWHTVAQFA